MPPLWPRMPADVGHGRTVPVLALSASLVVLPWLEGGRTEPSVLLPVGLGATALVGRLAWGPAHLEPRRIWGALIVVGYAWGSLAWSRCPNETLSAALVTTALALIWVSIDGWTGHAGDCRLLLGALAASLALSALPALRQVSSGAMTPGFWLDPEFRQAIPLRVTGPFLNPNVYAGYLSYALPLCLAWALHAPGWAGRLAALASGLATAGLLLTYSRSGWMAAGLGCALVVACAALSRCIRYPWRLAPAVLAALVVCVSNPAGVSQRATRLPHAGQGTLDHRTFIWSAGLAMWRDAPLQGVGLGCFGRCYASARPRGVLERYAIVAEPGSAHSDYVQLASETGCLGIAVGLLAALVVVRRRRDPGDAAGAGASLPLLRWGAWGTVLAAAAGGLTQSNLQTPLCALLLLLALSAIADGPASAPAEARRPARAVRLTGAGLAVLMVIASLALHTAYWLRAAGEQAVRSGDIGHAWSCLQRSRRLNPVDAQTTALLADVPAAGLSPSPAADRPAAAEALYRRAIALDPRSGMLYCKLADTLEKQGRPDAAYEACEQACRLDWYRASFHLQAGRLAAAGGRTGIARHHLETAVALFPLAIELEESRSGPDADQTDILRRAREDAMRRLAELRSPAQREAR